MIEHIAGGDRTAGGIDFEKNRLNRWVFFRLFQVGNYLLHHARPAIQRQFPVTVGNEAVDRNDQDFLLAFALQGILLKRFRISREKRDPGLDTAAAEQQANHQRYDPTGSDDPRASIHDCSPGHQRLAGQTACRRRRPLPCTIPPTVTVPLNGDRRNEELRGKPGAPSVPQNPDGAPASAGRSAQKVRKKWEFASLSGSPRRSPPTRIIRNPQ